MGFFGYIITFYTGTYGRFACEKPAELQTIAPEEL